MGQSNYFYLIKLICLHMVTCYQVFLSNTNNFQTDLFGSGCNNNELHIPQNPKTGASPPDIV